MYFFLGMFILNLFSTGLAENIIIRQFVYGDKTFEVKITPQQIQHIQKELKNFSLGIEPQMSVMDVLGAIFSRLHLLNTEKSGVQEITQYILEKGTILLFQEKAYEFVSFLNMVTHYTYFIVDLAGIDSKLIQEPQVQGIDTNKVPASIGKDSLKKHLQDAQFRETVFQVRKLIKALISRALIIGMEGARNYRSCIEAMRYPNKEEIKIMLNYEANLWKNQ
jgi:hypothetical protein